MPRILLIEDDADYRRLLRHHLSIVAPLVEIAEHLPERDGTMPPELVGAGYDFVILGVPSEGKQMQNWLKDLTDRPYFPPVICCSDRNESGAAVEADLVGRGALGVVFKAKIDPARLRALVETALQRRRESVNAFRQSPGAERVYRFGSTIIKGARCIRPLASSALSTVYLAESEKAGRLVVLKVFGQVPDRADEKNNTFDRFLQEYQIIAGISHPNVVRIYDLGVADDHAYITMEYFPAGDLRTRIRRGLDVGGAGYMLRQMCEALGAIHAVGVLHRDLKPGNVMLRTDGTIVLIDFGLAKQVELDAEITATGEIFGTPYYMSPEQGHGRDVDERSDIYSLGVIFYEMLTGQKPFIAPTPMAVIYKHSHMPLPALPDAVAHWTGVLSGMLAKQPEDRFGSAAKVVAAIDRVHAGRESP